MKKTIGVIFGGNSVEHEISIITALQAMENFDEAKYETIPIYLSKDHSFYSHKDFKNIELFKDLIHIEKKYSEKIFVKKDKDIYIKNKKSYINTNQQKIDVFFPIVHGTNVEDGKLQGFLETLNFPYVGANAVSATIGQHKSIMKDILKANNIYQTNYVWVTEREYDTIVKKIEENLNYPVIVKPESLGSSIGIFTANTPQELLNNIDEAFKYDSILVIEELLENFEEVNISVACIDDEIRTSAIEKVKATADVLSYEDKYLTSNTKKNQVPGEGMASLARELPAQVEEKIEVKIHEIAKEIYSLLRCTGIIRIDMMLKDGKLFVNEINNIPGSLSFYLWEEVGVKYKDLLTVLVEQGIRAYYKKISKKYSFSTNVLSIKNGKMKS